MKQAAAKLTVVRIALGVAAGIGLAYAGYLEIEAAPGQIALAEAVTQCFQKDAGSATREFEPALAQCLKAANVESSSPKVKGILVGCCMRDSGWSVVDVDKWREQAGWRRAP